jgi:hypothetical protein
MANSGSGRRSGNPKKPAGTGNRARPATTSGSGAGGAANAANAKQSADERARERVAQQRSAPRRGLQGAPSRSSKAKSARRAPQQRSTTVTAGIFGSVFVVLAVVVIVLIATLGGGKGKVAAGASIPTKPAPASIVSGVTQVPASELNAAGAGGGQVIFLGAEGSGSPVVAIKNPKSLTVNGKPEVVYVGGEFCPFCAATRWALAIALSKFGTLSGLKITASSPDDFAPNTRTLSFDGVTYSSPYISFSETEQVSNVCTGTQANPNPPPALECVAGYTALQKAPADVLALVTKYDASPYFPAKSAGGIPFIDMGGKYVEDGAPYPSTATAFPPISMAGLSWAQIVATFSVPTTGVGQAVLGAANHYIAAFCQLTHNKPGSVCTMSGVKAVAAAGLK